MYELICRRRVRRIQTAYHDRHLNTPYRESDQVIPFVDWKSRNMHSKSPNMISNLSHLLPRNERSRFMTEKQWKNPLNIVSGERRTENYSPSIRVASHGRNGGKVP